MYFLICCRPPSGYLASAYWMALPPTACSSCCFKMCQQGKVDLENCKVGCDHLGGTCDCCMDLFIQLFELLLSVNWVCSIFVMREWGKTMGCEGANVKMISDGNTELSRVSHCSTLSCWSLFKLHMLFKVNHWTYSSC